MHRQQQSQRTKVEHRPWNDASFYFYKDTNDLGSLFWEEGGGEIFPRATLPCLCRAGHRRRTLTQRPILSGVYTTQCTSHYSPLSHNDRYLLASHSRPIPLIWTLCYAEQRPIPAQTITEYALPLINWLLERLRLQLCGYSSNTCFNSFYQCLSEVTRHNKTPPLDNFLWRTPLRFYAVFLSLLRNYEVLLDTRYNWLAFCQHTSADHYQGHARRVWLWSLQQKYFFSTWPFSPVFCNNN